MRHGAWKSKVFGQESGFTLIEALLAVVLIAIIATVAVTQYTDFTIESKNAATRESLALIRNGIQKQFSQQKLRCGLFASNANGAAGYTWPTLNMVNRNDITVDGTPCDTNEVPNQTDRYFVAGSLPANPWSHPYCTEAERRTVVSYQPIYYINWDPDAQGINYADSRADETVTSGSRMKKCGWVYDVKNGIIKTGTNYAGESVF